MRNRTKFKSSAFEAIHIAASGLHRAGGIDKATMRDFDESCLLTPLDSVGDGAAAHQADLDKVIDEALAWSRQRGHCNDRR